MKILKIAFKNINSLRGEHLIDFTQEPFVRNTLFAITGPTGSGKTTILDVISLALFNHVPRLGKMTNAEVIKKGAILTRNQKEAFAKVTYQCAQGVFVSTWSISTARTGNLRDYHMEVANVKTEKILPLKKSEVPAENESLIGLNYDQFIKSVVLAQGEFAKFLQVPKKERGALLEKITGTEIYRSIGKMVHEKHKERAALIDTKKAKIVTFKEQLLDDAAYLEKTTEAQKITVERGELKKKLERLSQAITLKKELVKQQAQLSQTQSLLQSTVAKQEEFDKQKGEKLKKHLQIQLVADSLNTWLSLREKASEKQKEITAASGAVAQANQRREKLIQHFQEKFRLHITRQNFAEAISEYKNKVRQNIAEREALRVAFKAHQKPVAEAAAYFQLDFDPNKLQAFRAKIEEKQAALKNAAIPLQRQLNPKDQAVEELQEETQEQLRQVREAQKAQMQITYLVKQEHEQQSALEQLNKQQEGLPKTIDQLGQQLDLKEAQLAAKQKTLEVEQLQKQLDDYRRDLKKEEPCPLCGSVHHPYAHGLPQGENGLKNAITALQNDLKTLSKKQVEKQSEFEQLNKQITHCNLNLDKVSKELNSVKKAFDEKFKTVFKAEELQDLHALESTLERQLEDLAKAKKIQEDAAIAKKLLQQTADLQHLITKGRKKKEAIAGLFTGTHFEQEISTAENDWNSNEQTYSQQKQLKTNAEEALQKTLNHQQAVGDKLLERLKAQGYLSIENALDNRLPAEDARAWAEEREALQRELLKLGTLQEKLQEEIKILQKTAVTETLDELDQQHQETEKALTDTEALAVALSRSIENQKQYLAAIAQLEQQIERDLKDTKHWQILFDLIGDATGNKFNDFAQDLTLAQLLQLANKRLARLTDRYRIDQPNDNEDDSLVAIDEHMGGQRRSIKTLSGGETFILSLALALALSDLASRNVEINSLFIDEGFGTLDPETLDQTLDTLEVLQAESSKMIGIISHVESLKERIATQIRLSQNGQGYSSLTVA